MRNKITNLWNKKKILVGSPVYQKPKILEAFLTSLKALHYHGASLDYIFVDDNAEEASKRMLFDFRRNGSFTVILPGNKDNAYVCDEESHHWDDSLMQKVADYKNKMIQYALDHGYNGIFFVDSDLILHPDLLIHLKSRKKEIVSELFWSQWHKGLPLEPNVWLFDEYDLVPKHPYEVLSEEEQEKRRDGFLAMLKKPGIYEVGGLGACTLISRSALLKGVSFAPIKNLTIHGEDRFFCIRASVLGIKLFADTSFPAFHIYREADLAGAADYISQCKAPLLSGRKQ